MSGGPKTPKKFNPEILTNRASYQKFKEKNTFLSSTYKANTTAKKFSLKSLGLKKPINEKKKNLNTLPAMKKSIDFEKLNRKLKSFSKISSSREPISSKTNSNKKYEESKIVSHKPLFKKAAELIINARRFNRSLKISRSKESPVQSEPVIHPTKNVPVYSKSLFGTESIIRPAIKVPVNVSKKSPIVLPKQYDLIIEKSIESEPRKESNFSAMIKYPYPSIVANLNQWAHTIPLNVLLIQSQLSNYRIPISKQIKNVTLPTFKKENVFYDSRQFGVTHSCTDFGQYFHHVHKDTVQDQSIYEVPDIAFYPDIRGDEYTENYISATSEKPTALKVCPTNKMVNGIFINKLVRRSDIKDIIIPADTLISSLCVIQGTVKIGKGCQIHPSAFILAKKGSIQIGENNIIKEQVVIINTTEALLKIGNNNIMEAGAEIYDDCVIGDNNVINSKCILKKGARVGNQCIIKNYASVDDSVEIPNHYVFINSKNILPNLETNSRNYVLQHKTLVEYIKEADAEILNSPIDEWPKKT